MKARKVPVEITFDQRLAAFTARLTPEMADALWAADLARRLLAYDPLAETYETIRFLPDSRIVVDYRPTGGTRILTFVVPRWTPPAD